MLKKVLILSILLVVTFFIIEVKKEYDLEKLVEKSYLPKNIVSGKDIVLYDKEDIKLILKNRKDKQIIETGTLVLQNKNKIIHELPEIQIDLENTSIFNTQLQDLLGVQTSGDLILLDKNDSKWLLLKKYFIPNKIQISNFYTNNPQYKYITIEPSIDDQCDNPKIHKAYLKGVITNGKLQKIFNKDYSLECIEEGEMGDFASIDIDGVNVTLDKIFFSIEINSSVKKNLSYNLKTYEAKEELPINLLTKSNEQPYDLRKN